MAGSYSRIARDLNERTRLERIDRVSCVSGKDAAGGHLLQDWKRPTWAPGILQGRASSVSNSHSERGRGVSYYYRCREELDEGQQWLACRTGGQASHQKPTEAS